MAKIFSSSNSYLAELMNLFKEISHKSSNEVIHKIYKQLMKSRMNRYNLTIKEIIAMNRENKTVVFVGKLLDDLAVMNIPQMTIVCLKASRTVKQRVEKAGGKIYTLDCLFAVAPTLDVCFVKGDPTRRKSTRFFGPAPGDKNSKTKSRSVGKGRTMTMEKKK